MRIFTLHTTLIQLKEAACSEEETKAAELKKKLSDMEMACEVLIFLYVCICIDRAESQSQMCWPWPCKGCGSGRWRSL